MGADFAEHSETHRIDAEIAAQQVDEGEPAEEVCPAASPCRMAASAAAIRRRVSAKRPRPAAFASGMSTGTPPPKRGKLGRSVSPEKEGPRPPLGVAARLDWRSTDRRRREELRLMQELRRERDAPVDALFNTSIADPQSSPEVRDFHVFVAVFLSSQTRDEVTAAAMGRLKQRLKGGLTVETVLSCRQGTLAGLMKPVAFHNTKAKNLKSIASSLKAKYNHKVPVDADALCELPGIGPKMAHIVVTVLTGNPQGIGIDVHVHRITNKLGWVSSKEPEQTREQLQKLLPYSEWSQVNIIMVGLGQQMHSKKSTLLQRCLETSCPVGAFRMLRKLDFDFSHRDAATGQGVLHWAAAAGNMESVRMLLKIVKPHQDSNGQWPWDASCAEVSRLFERTRAKYQR